MQEASDISHNALNPLSVADPDQGYQGLSIGQIFNPKELAELKRELSKAVVLRIYSLLTITIEALSLLSNSFSQN